MDSDSVLLDKYVGSRDATAFATLANRYARMVYSAAMRITGNSHDAEEITQECFFTLARDAGSVQSSLPGWLYCVAVRRAKNLVRGSIRRRVHENEVPPRKHAGEADAAWTEIAPFVDEAISELPAELRQALVLHYLQGQTQEQVAEELRVNQSTVSRRINSAVETLRGKLRKSGVIASAAVLASLLAQETAEAVPATLGTTLGKMAVSGVGKAAPVAKAGFSFTGGMTVAKTVGISVVLAGVLAVGGFLVYKADSAPESSPVAPVPPSATSMTPPLPNPPTISGGLNLGIESEVFSANEMDWLNNNKVAYWLQVRLSPDGTHLLYYRPIQTGPLAEGERPTYELVLRDIATREDFVLPTPPYPSGYETIQTRLNPFDPSGRNVVLMTIDVPNGAQATNVVVVNIRGGEVTSTNIIGIARFDRTGTKLIGRSGEGLFVAELPGMEITPLEPELAEPIGRRGQYPVSVCPTEDIICTFGLEFSEGQRPRGGISLCDLTGHKITGLPTHPKNSSMDDLEPQWTPNGRYICYYDLEQDGDDTVQGTRIFDRIALKEKTFVRNYAPIGPGPDEESVVLICLDKEDPRGAVYQVEAERTWELGEVGTRLMHATNGKVAYLKPLENDETVMCVAEIVIPTDAP